jgi:hypothetical protein
MVVFLHPSLPEVHKHIYCKDASELEVAYLEGLVFSTIASYSHNDLLLLAFNLWQGLYKYHHEEQSQITVLGDI